MTAELKIQREKITDIGDEFQTFILAEIESFTLLVSERPQDSGIYQAKIIDENSSVILISPELEFERFMEKIHLMIDSLGKVVKVEASGNELNFNSFLQKENSPG